mgnify:CR=1 FL=1
MNDAEYLQMIGRLVDVQLPSIPVTAATNRVTAAADHGQDHPDDKQDGPDGEQDVQARHQ